MNLRVWEHGWNLRIGEVGIEVFITYGDDGNDCIADISDSSNQ